MFSKSHKKHNSLKGEISYVENLIRVQVPVLQRTFDQAGYNHEQQHQNVDAGEHFIDHGWLLYPEGQQAYSKQNVVQNTTEQSQHKGTLNIYIEKAFIFRMNECVSQSLF